MKNKDTSQQDDLNSVGFEVRLKARYVEKYRPILDSFLTAQVAHINETGRIIPFSTEKIAYGGSVKGNLFRKAGEGYEISFDSRPSFWIAATTGLQYFEILLRNPNRDIHVSRMLTIIGEPGDSKTQGADASFDLSMDTGMQEPTIDTSAYRTVTSALEELRNEVSQNGFQMALERKDRLQDEILKLEKYLRNAGKRKVDFQTNKQRIRVKNALTEALTKIRRYDFRLYQHLDRHIETGVHCRYNIDYQSAPWQFE